MYTPAVCFQCTLKAINMSIKCLWKVFYETRDYHYLQVHLNQKMLNVDVKVGEFI